jgi:hypothetical protein
MLSPHAGRGEKAKSFPRRVPRPSFATTTPREQSSFRFAPGNQRGSGAPKGAPSNAPRTPNKCRHLSARAGARQTGARPPSGASLRHSPAQSQPHWLSSRTTFPGTGLGRVFCPPRACPVQRAPRRPVPLPAKWCPRAARVRTANPPAGTALAPLFRLAFRKGALDERMRG